MELARRGERQVGVEGAEVRRKGFGVMVGSEMMNCRGRVGVGRKTSKRRESGKQVEKYKEKVMEPRYP